jgi:hypothetical protein
VPLQSCCRWVKSLARCSWFGSQGHQRYLHRLSISLCICSSSKPPVGQPRSCVFCLHALCIRDAQLFLSLRHACCSSCTLPPVAQASTTLSCLKVQLFASLADAAAVIHGLECNSSLQELCLQGLPAAAVQQLGSAVAAGALAGKLTQLRLPSCRCGLLWQLHVCCGVGACKHVQPFT